MILLKAVMFGGGADLGIAYLMHRGGQELGGMTALRHVVVAGQSFYWSWPIFCVLTALAWAILSLLD